MKDLLNNIPLGMIDNAKHFVRQNIHVLAALTEIGVSRKNICALLHSRGFKQVQPNTLTKYLAEYQHSVNAERKAECIELLLANLQKPPTTDRPQTNIVGKHLERQLTSAFVAADAETPNKYQRF